MSRRPRRNHSTEFRAKVAVAAIRGEKTLAELASQFDVRLNQIRQWKTQLLERATEVSPGAGRANGEAVRLLSPSKSPSTS